VQANDGTESSYAQGASVTVHLPPESLRVLPEMPEPVADPDAPAPEGEPAPAA